MVVWIGYLQWNHLNGISNKQVPVLERLNNIRRQDALLDGESETEWADADFIVGNPPFLGNYKMRQELGDEYTQKLYDVYSDRVPNGSDLVCYWFEKARAAVQAGTTQRVGLITTNSIRGGTNRKVLESIKETGDIFMAWSDEPWILDGAAVRVSMVGFDNGTQMTRTLNGQDVARINPDLTVSADISLAKALEENKGLSFKGVEPGGPFDIEVDTAQKVAPAPPTLKGWTMPMS